MKENNLKPLNSDLYVKAFQILEENNDIQAELKINLLVEEYLLLGYSKEDINKSINRRLMYDSQSNEEC